MNKKLLIGLSSIGMAAGFWACGSGSIEPMADDTDVFVEAMLNNLDFSTQINDAMSKCNEDIVCMNEMAKAAHGAVELSSESTLPESSADGQPVVSSSSDSFYKFSSIGDAGTIPVVSSSSEENAPMTGMGRCFPSVETVDMGGQVSWSIEWNKAVVTDADLFQSPTYNWTFGTNASPASATTKSASVSYSESGPKSASVAVSVANGSKKGTIVCDKTVNVNGAKITGCVCAPVGVTGSVDYTKTPDVTWSVTGCSTVATAMPLTYKWEGVVGTESYSHTFTAAAASYAPKLKVENTDNSSIDVTCSAVKVTEGAEYTIKDNTDAGKISLPAAGTYNVVIAFACQNKTFFCNGVGAPVGGSVNGTPMAESWYTTASLSAADCSGSATVSVEVTGPATCGAQ